MRMVQWAATVTNLTCYNTCTSCSRDWVLDDCLLMFGSAVTIVTVLLSCPIVPRCIHSVLLLLTTGNNTTSSSRKKHLRGRSAQRAYVSLSARWVSRRTGHIFVRFEEDSLQSRSREELHYRSCGNSQSYPPRCVIPTLLIYIVFLI